jgi:hypothetical protein
MKNEQKFKQKIAEIAARIAEASYGEKEEEMKPERADEYKKPAEAGPNQSAPIDVDKFNAKLDTYDQALKSFYSAINNAQELELALVHIIEKMPNLTPGNGITGMRRAIDRMAEKKANASTNSNDVPDVDAADEKKLGMPELPGLQEAFNRINRK